MIKKTDYTRPELTEEDQKNAAQDYQRLIKKFGYGNLPLMMKALCLENMRLVKECNEHRAARGIAPLPTFEV